MVSTPEVVVMESPEVDVIKLFSLSIKHVMNDHVFVQGQTLANRTKPGLSFQL